MKLNLLYLKRRKMPFKPLTAYFRAGLFHQCDWTFWLFIRCFAEMKASHQDMCVCALPEWYILPTSWYFYSSTLCQPAYMELPPQFSQQRKSRRALIRRKLEIWRSVKNFKREFDLQPIALESRVFYEYRADPATWMNTWSVSATERATEKWKPDDGVDAWEQIAQLAE